MRQASAASLAAAALAAHSAWNLRYLRRAATRPSSRRVSVLVPARNEAGRIEPCLHALLRSQGVDFELLVLDDCSDDGTAEVVRRVAGAGARLRLLTGAEPPAGWLGKPHACAQLAAAAHGDVLVFVDADVIVVPGALAACVALLSDTPLDLVSPYPRQLASGVAARLVQPLLQWSWLTFLPLRLAERSPRPSLTAANGQLMACTAAAYRAAGGHARVRDAVIEDVALAREFKRAGYRACVADGAALATCRMYDSWPELRDGYAKSLWAAFGSPSGALAAMGLLGWLYVLPPVAALAALASGRPRQALMPAAGYLASVAGRALCAWRTGGRIADAPAHPLSIMTLAGLTVYSWRRKRSRRLAWRGRPVSDGHG